MKIESVPTRGRTLDHAAAVYDFLEPFFLLGKQAEYDQKIVELLDPAPSSKVLDLGCGTGVLCRMIAEILRQIQKDYFGGLCQISRRREERKLLLSANGLYGPLPHLFAGRQAQTRLIRNRYSPIFDLQSFIKQGLQPFEVFDPGFLRIASG